MGHKRVRPSVRKLQSVSVNLAINGIRLVGRRFGVGRYIEYLLRNWATMESPFERMRLYTPRAIDDPFPLPPFVDHQIIRTRFSNAYWEQVALPRRHRQGDLLFCPSYVAPLAARSPIVLTHLGSYEAIPSAFRLFERIKTRLLYQLSAHKAKVVITVSESSKADIIRFYGVKADKIRVIPLGVDPKFQPVNDVAVLRAVRQKYFGCDRPYILFVGKLSRRRNIPELIAAFARLTQEHQLHHGLLLIGQNSVGHDVQQLAKDAGVAGSVVHQEFENHNALVNIYNAADLFIYPSSYEGFGIPVLEAMACGVPTIALHNSAFIEFASGAYLCKEGSVEALYEGMCAVLFSKDLQAELRRKGLACSKDYGWNEIARKTLNVLIEAAALGGKNHAL
jgi:glycosyltransferase involved in cell wall biosynthesis